MLLALLLFAALATAFAVHKGVAREGLAESGKLILQMGPVLLVAFVLAGMVSVLISPETIGDWLGREAGFRALLVGTLAGALTPAGPFVAFPLLAVLLKGGASVGAVAAYLTAWALLGIHRVAALEIPILGWRFALVRYLVSLAAPVVIGFLAQLVSTKLP
jgi:uncharacterized membrane protein YraQ (UPF0718 family)